MPFTRTDLTPLADGRYVDTAGDRIEAIGVASPPPTDPVRLIVNSPTGTSHDPGAAVSLAPDADGVKGLVVLPNSAGQTANLVEVQAVGGSPLVAIGPGGQMAIATQPNSGCQLLIQSGSASRKAVSLVRAPSQTANIFEVVDTNLTTLFVAVTSGGALRIARGLSLISQSFAQNGTLITTLAVFSPTFVRLTGSGGGTVNLPNTGLLDGLVFILRNAGLGVVTIAGNGIPIDGGASINLNPSSSVSLRYEATVPTWDTF